ncbi:DUF4822 domain-containing protein [Elizabethkingia meningoseptica]|uniref:DUF4822 domain-containing protein n=1 Tax=Elizabethkingia meningoseptica TaxID=238 RepID=UPI002DD626C7|nr:DUF4822 domain-containing protein [Elizabethkingia meningoseptica]MEC4713260.1 DUF4822 domain-containing protein [Elizabethkingia meningoseptica]
MKNKNLFSVLALLLIALFSFSCSNNDDNREPDLTPGQTLAYTPWVTSNAKNAAGANVDLKDPNVSNFVGFAYFKADGTFTMYNLDDSPKMHGDWSVSADGKTRTIVAKNDKGETLFTRVVDITVLTKAEFTYRIYPDAANKSVFYDIIHTPTTHKEQAK